MFPERERYLLMTFDELREPLALARKCFEFLGVDPDFEPELTSENITRPYPTLELRFERIGAGRALGWLPDRLKRSVRSLLGKSGSAPRMKLEEAKKAEIRAMLRDEMRALERDYGIDVARWGFAEPAGQTATATAGA